MSKTQKNVERKEVEERPSDRFIPYYFVAFFLFLFVADSFFVYLAVSTHTGVVNKNAYRDGLDYNDTIAQSKAQAKLGWKVNIYRQDNNIYMTLRDSKNQAISGANVIVNFIRPTQDGYDFELALTEKNIEKNGQAGLYQVEAFFPLSGQWVLKGKIVQNEDIFKQSKKIVVE